MKRFIEVRTQFEGLHRWPDAPDEVGFLKTKHRHMFHVRVRIGVGGDDRELEFIIVKNRLLKFIDRTTSLNGTIVKDLGSMSCEMMARNIGKHILRSWGPREIEVEVSEDGENGAIVQLP